MTVLPPPTSDQAERAQIAPQKPTHASWAGVPLEDEIAQSRTVLEKIVPDLVVVDHYALDARWESTAIPRGTPVMVIDDLADRPHLCDILLDQNLGRLPEDYLGLVPPQCKLVLGPNYALLRPEFAKLRGRALARRKEAKIKRLLITFGGTDKDNATGAVLEAMSNISLPENLEVTVIMGHNAPWLVPVRTQAEAMPRPTRVLCGVSNMADLMTEADLCIGAAGSTSWERCTLGLPTLLLTVADNQIPSAKALAAANAACYVGDIRQPGWAKAISHHLQAVFETGPSSQTLQYSSVVSDGEGAKRVGAIIVEDRLILRQATMDDAEMIWRWRNAGGASMYYRDTAVPSLDDHCAWIEKTLDSPERILLIVYKGNKPVAHVRFDRQNEDPRRAEISIYVGAEYRGQRIGLRSLSHACEYADKIKISRLDAVVHKKNEGSRKLFEAAGFELIETEGNFSRYYHLFTTPREKKS